MKPRNNLKAQIAHHLEEEHKKFFQRNTVNTDLQGLIETLERYALSNFTAWLSDTDEGNFINRGETSGDEYRWFCKELVSDFLLNKLREDSLRKNTEEFTVRNRPEL